MAQILKPCPFCGGEGRIESSTQSTLSWPLWKHYPSCPLNAAKMYRNVKEALKAGNTRHSDPDDLREAHAAMRWVYEHGMKPDHSRPEWVSDAFDAAFAPIREAALSRNVGDVR